MTGPGTAPALLDWYDAERRDLPWRCRPGQRPDAYQIWLSEIMLQQTTVKAVIPYYATFLRRWPTIRALAEADLDDVLAAWAGLGYYSRARNLHACARVVVARYRGRLPRSEKALMELPGIGPYTAAAIAAIAFGRPTTPVDGNIERVVARLFALRTPLPKAKFDLKRLAATLTPAERAGDFAQAMMDLGAAICTPKRPSCLMCPLQGHCAARALGIEVTLPVRAVVQKRPLRRGVAFLAVREDGCLLLRKRPAAGLLGGMLEVPSTDWIEDWVSADDAMRSAPVRAAWSPVPGSISHTFTHFRLELMLYRTLVGNECPLHLWARPEDCRWVHRRDLHAAAVPSVMRKLVAHALHDP